MTVLDREFSRRCALFGVGGLGAAAALAACGGGSTSTGAVSAPAGSSAAGGSTSTSSAAPSGSGSAAPSGSDAIAPLSDVPVGGTATVTVDGESVLLSQPTAGTAEAFSSVCPHQGGLVKPNGNAFKCTLHGSEFDIDGKVTRGPARKDLTAIAVSVSGDSIVKG